MERCWERALGVEGRYGVERLVGGICHDIYLCVCLFPFFLFLLYIVGVHGWLEGSGALGIWCYGCLCLYWSFYFWTVFGYITLNFAGSAE